MNDRSSRRQGGIRQVPLDHLREGSKPQTPARSVRPERPERPDAQPSENALGPEPAIDDANDANDLVRGKATRTPEAVATRRHLEGSEQGPV